MNIWIIYRLHLDDKKLPLSFQPIEYCDNETDARKYTRLFELQTPNYERQHIIYRNQLCSGIIQ